MKRLPCENIIWYGIPVVRRELAFCLINQFGLSQKDAANKLGITPSAVSQYISKKRGRIEISDTNLLDEIKLSANNIIENGGESVISETCRICKLLRASGEFNLFCPGCDED